jgi:hypothetical protein
MDDQQAGNEEIQLPGKVEVMQRIFHSRTNLENAINFMSKEQLIQPGADGWSPKDHLIHLAIWELGVAVLLGRRPRFAAMQVEEAVLHGKSMDEVNDLIYSQNAELPLPEVMDKFRNAHMQLLEALEELDDEELLMAYANYTEDGSGDPDRPVLNWVIGNTYEHFDEHLGYIQRILRGSMS